MKQWTSPQNLLYEAVDKLGAQEHTRDDGGNLSTVVQANPAYLKLPKPNKLVRERIKALGHNMVDADTSSSSTKESVYEDVSKL